MDDSELLRVLPTSELVNVSALARLFSNTHTSYKFLFFISLLDITRRGNFGIDEGISLSDLFVEMLANAWYPHNYFKLSFGKADRIARRLDSLNLEISEPILQFKDSEKKLLREEISSQDLRTIFRELKKNVAFRLIVPFLEKELKDADVSLSRGEELSYQIPLIARQNFHSKKPLYKFDRDEYTEVENIIIHPAWLNYISENYSIIRGWASWEWLNYMQKRNPNIPGIANKLFMPKARTSFPKTSSQRKYWQLVLDSEDLKCIYSEQEIDPKRFDLDHYLPWSFVAHDQLWNLIPIVPAVNSSKSNNLPSNKYFQDFIQLQHLSLTITHERMGQKAWINAVESYISDLRVEPSDLLDMETLRNAYEATINPLIVLASKQGFAPGWTYTSSS